MQTTLCVCFWNKTESPSITSSSHCHSLSPAGKKRLFRVCFDRMRAQVSVGASRRAAGVNMANSKQAAISFRPRPQLCQPRLHLVNTSFGQKVHLKHAASQNVVCRAAAPQTSTDVNGVTKDEDALIANTRIISFSSANYVKDFLHEPFGQLFKHVTYVEVR